jgi:hypothetical protein
MAIQGTIKFVNESKLNPTTNKWSQSIKVAIPGQADVYVNGPSGSFDTYQKDTQVMIEQDGKWWRLAKDQSGLQVTAPGAPMSTTPAAVTNGQGYGGTANGYEVDPEAFRNRALLLAETFCAVSKVIQNSAVYGMSTDEVISKAAISIMISLEKPAARP